MMERSRKSVAPFRPLTWTIIALLLLAFLSGCTQDEAAPSSSSESNSNKSVTITIGYQTPTAQTWGALIVKNQGLYEKHLQALEPETDFKIEWFDSSSGPPLNNGMIAGKIQLAFMGDMPILTNGYKGQTEPNYRSVFLAFDGKGLNGKNQAILVPPNGAKTLQDLAGQTISVTLGSSAHRMLLAALEKNGLLDEVEIVDHSVMVGLQSIEQNKIAAHASWEPFPSLMLHRGTGEFLFDGAETGIDYLDGVVADRRWVEAHPDYTVAFIKALIEAHQLIKNEPEQAAEIFAGESDFPIEVTRKMVQNIRFDAAIYERDLITLKGSAHYLQELDKIGELDLEQFVDDRYLRQAVEELNMTYLTDEERQGEWIEDKLY